MFTSEYYAVCDCHQRHDTHDNDRDSAKAWLLKNGWTFDGDEATCPDCTIKKLNIGDKVTFRELSKHNLKPQSTHGIIHSVALDFVVDVSFDGIVETISFEDLLPGWV